jgi:hypothetical protein
MKYDYKVCVKCLTYNHAPYIEDTLNGFCIQKTSFPFVCAIIDDASPDGEQEVIKQYIESNFDLKDDYAQVIDDVNYKLIIARHKENKQCIFAAYLLKYNHNHIRDVRNNYISEWLLGSEYIAHCEGDDYWIDSLKLQKQVDFLEKNLDFGMVHTDFDLVKGRRNHFKSQPDVIEFPDLLVKHINIGTLTVLYRTSIYKGLPRYNQGKNWPMGDFPTWLEISHASKIKYLRDVTAKYRVLESSASHSNDIMKSVSYINKGYEIKEYYANIYGVNADSIYDEDYYEEIVRVASRLRSFDVAKQYYSLAKKKNLISWRCRLFYLTAKYPILRKIVSIYIAV